MGCVDFKGCVEGPSRFGQDCWKSIKDLSLEAESTMFLKATPHLLVIRKVLFMGTSLDKQTTRWPQSVLSLAFLI